MTAKIVNHAVDRRLRAASRKRYIGGIETPAEQLELVFVEEPLRNVARVPGHKDLRGLRHRQSP